MLSDVTSGLSQWWAPALAFAAGVVSFASPCVFPLVPGYLAFVSGADQEEKRPIVPILMFILGFAAVFTALGAFTRVFQPLLKSETGLRVAGLVVLAFGVVMILYALRIGWPGLYAERRPLLSKVHPGPAGALPLGMSFAVGWTPCIGPVLGAILGIASAQGGSARGAWLLFVYSMGLGLPFLLVGLGVRRLMGALDFVKRNYHWFAGVSGTIMVAIGILLVSGAWQTWITPIINRLSQVTPPL
jgi:cytochrome c-type biogenesis protein